MELGCTESVSCDEPDPGPGPPVAMGAAKFELVSGKYTAAPPLSHCSLQ